MGEEGFEPSRSFEQGILSPQRQSEGEDAKSLAANQLRESDALTDGARADLSAHIQQLFDAWPGPIDSHLRDAILEIVAPTAGEPDNSSAQGTSTGVAQ